MGEVWLARHKLLGRDVAVKFLLGAVTDTNDPAFAQFITGARAAAAVAHPGLNQIYHADVAGGVPYLVLELLDGRNLEEVLHELQQIDLDAGRAIIEAVCEAVAELHHRDLVHRDLKPSNFILTAEGRVVVTDYGLACAKAATVLGANSGCVAGTPPYMAPEMFDGIVSARTDVYALGICAYQLLCGPLPFTGSLDELRHEHRTAAVDVQPLRAAGVPDGVIEVIVRATSKDVIFRPKSGRHLLDAFRTAFDAAGIHCAGRLQLADLLKRCSPPVHQASNRIAVPNDTFPQMLSTIAMRRRERRGRNQSPSSIADQAPQRADSADRERRKAEQRRQKLAAWAASILGALISYPILIFTARHAQRWDHWVIGTLTRMHALAPPPNSGPASAPVLPVWVSFIIAAPQGAIFSVVGFTVSLWLYSRLRGQRLPEVDGRTKCGWCQHELRGISMPLCSECGHRIGHSGPDAEGLLPLALQRGHRMRVLIFLYTLFLALSSVIAVLGGVALSLVGGHARALIGTPFFTPAVVLLSLRAVIGAYEISALLGLGQSGRAWCRSCNAELRDLTEPICPACGERI